MAQEQDQVEQRLRELEAEPEYRDHPLMEELRWLAKRYAKLERQLRKVSRIGDMLQGRLKESNSELEQVALTDLLTGLPNRRAMHEALRTEVNRAERTGSGLAIAMMDVDHFKAINDEHGHGAGDAALQFLAGRLLETLRDYDQCGRWGGEELLILLPGLDEPQALQAADRLRSSVAEAPFDWQGKSIPLTISIGVAVREPDETVDDLLVRSDRALYAAKESGRNTVRAASPAPA